MIVRADRLEVVGSAGDDRLTGSRLAEVLDGGRGDDVLAGRSGDDMLLGDAGDDRLSGGRGADLVVSTAGTDTVSGDDGRDELVAASSRPATVRGGDGSDFVWRWFTPGEAGVLDGGAGRNQLELMAQFPSGDTTVAVDRAAGTAVARYDAATATASFAGFGAFILEGGPAWTYRGTDDDDFLQVLDGRVRATTLGGDDVVLGDSWNDRIDGGADIDTAFGAEGNNTGRNVERGDCQGRVSQLRSAPARAHRAVVASLPADLRRLVERYAPSLR